ncbi:putative ankyrin repeat protein RF_0381 [Aplysia californica]|uniref:Ankyrin repeat protein RF_0381 n=1 Tax=Aplysia californica TaxID=6500 RepID=A0ABM0K2R8_APLCA|nr:putative ankyrin repeat protein RF_0381 [Aplysia californica]
MGVNLDSGVSQRSKTKEDQELRDMSIIDLTKSAREDLVVQVLHDNPSSCLLVDEEERTALHWAVEFGYARLTQLLVSAQLPTDASTATKGGFLNKRDSKGHTALHIACNAKRSDIASLLVTLKADLSATDQSGNTPLHRAVRNNLETTSILMCEYGADVNARNELQWTPLHEATRTGNENLLQVLIKHGADTNAVTHNHMSPFLTAFFYYKIASKGNSYPNLDNIWKVLIESGCQLSQSDGHWTPLTAAIACDNTFIAALLLFNGCQLAREGRWGRGMLQETFSCGEPMLVKLLVLLGYLPSPEEVQYCSKQIPMYSKVFTRLAGLGSGLHRDRQAVVTWLKQRELEPPSLAEWCRVSVRQAMNVSSGDRSFIGNIKELPLPNKLKQFIAMSDFTHYLCD